MIKYLKGNLLESEAEALVNTVNTVGVMGKGIALQFKNTYPNNYKVYKELCKAKGLDVGQLLAVKDSSLVGGEKLIINFPTKTSWRKPSEYSYIADGLKELRKLIQDREIKSIAIPPLGSGNGGLNWDKVKEMIVSELSDLDTTIFLYEPTKQIKEELKKEKAKLTPARAMLLAILYRLVRSGELVSEFSSEKVCYFLQRFGGQKHFKLTYTKQLYGPYSGKVRYVINHLNGSYLMGYSDLNKKAFEPLDLLMDTEDLVNDYLKKQSELLAIVENTDKFLSGFYSDFALELLATVDFIVQEKEITDKEAILSQLQEWNDRKREMFSQKKYIDITLSHLQKHNLIPTA